MTLTRQHALETIEIYIRAWVSQNPDLITTIFTEGATYHERVMGKPIPDQEAIREYWATKVARDQANIRCVLLALYIDGNTAVAEWEAKFDDLVQGVRKRMREVAILEFDGALISSLREYWASEQLGELDGGD